MLTYQRVYDFVLFLPGKPVFTTGPSSAATEPRSVFIRGKRHQPGRKQRNRQIGKRVQKTLGKPSGKLGDSWVFPWENMEVILLGQRLTNWKDPPCYEKVNYQEMAVHLTS